MMRTSLYLRVQRMLLLFLIPLSVIAQDFSHRWFINVGDEYWYQNEDTACRNIQGFRGYSIVTFKCPVNFKGALFREVASGFFYKSKFNSTADFSDATFDSSFYFDSVTFHSNVSFFRAKFDSNIFFRQVNFKRYASFKEVESYAGVSFTESIFDSTLDFRNTQFGLSANFRGATFKGQAIFTGIKLPKYMDFSYVTNISFPIDLTLSRLHEEQKKCKIALLGTNMDKIKINMQLFDLWFPDNPPYDQQVSVYERVLKKLKDEGFMESYKILDIEYQQVKYQNSGWFNHYIVNTFQRYWWNYQYSKEYVLRWGVGLWILFSLINLKLYRNLTDHVYAINFLEKLQNDHTDNIKKLIPYSFQVATYTAIIFFGLKMNLVKFEVGAVRLHPWLFLYLMVIYIVGLVCLGFI
ncbi:MAG: pentapeptide repeat-containing protein, partial [Ignavibacteriae bacterium]|nr:pentapeptide repeat-containing protein [Ignavibacteriota bacterium]